MCPNNLETHLKLTKKLGNDLGLEILVFNFKKVEFIRKEKNNKQSRQDNFKRPVEE